MKMIVNINKCVHRYNIYNYIHTINFNGLLKVRQFILLAVLMWNALSTFKNYTCILLNNLTRRRYNDSHEDPM